MPLTFVLLPIIPVSKVVVVVGILLDTCPVSVCMYLYVCIELLFLFTTHCSPI
jgi:hypothetical protein